MLGLWSLFMANPSGPSQCANHRWMWVAEVHENSPKSAQQGFCVVNWVVNWGAVRHTHSYNRRLLWDFLESEFWHIRLLRLIFCSKLSGRLSSDETHTRLFCVVNWVVNWVALRHTHFNTHTLSQMTPETFLRMNSDTYVVGWGTRKLSEISSEVMLSSKLSSKLSSGETHTLLHSHSLADGFWDFLENQFWYICGWLRHTKTLWNQLSNDFVQ